MKIVLSLLLSALPLFAQTNTNGVNLITLPKSTTKWRHSGLWSSYVEMAYLFGVRQWGNDIYDLRPARPMFESGEVHANGFHLLAGKVISVASDGLLVSLDTKVGFRPQAVFLYRAPFRDSVVDGEAFAAIGRMMKPYTYTSASGARSTVESYDCGEAPEKKWIEQLNARAKAEADKIELARQMTARDYELAKKEAKARRDMEADAKVVSAYRVRADSGDADAQYELALRYLSGKGVAKDYDAGTKLLEQASKQGHKKAAEKLKTLPRTATSPQPESPAK